MARPVARLLSIFSAIAAVLLIGALIVALRRPARPDVLPNPNGYDDFIKAGKALQAVNYSSLKGEEPPLSEPRVAQGSGPSTGG